jgi:hypothetical protein
MGCSNALMLDFPDSRTVRNTFFLFIRYPVYDILLERHEQTLTYGIHLFQFEGHYSQLSNLKDLNGLD